MSRPEFDQREFLQLARDRHYAKLHHEWRRGIDIARECVRVRGTFADYCWLSYFLRHMQRLDEALEAIDRAVQFNPESERAVVYRLGLIHEIENRSRKAAEQLRQRQMEKKAKERLSERQAERSSREAAERGLTRRLEEAMKSAQFRDPVSADPYEGLHELAIQAAGIAQRPIADSGAGGFAIPAARSQMPGSRMSTTASMAIASRALSPTITSQATTTDLTRRRSSSVQQIAQIGDG